VNDILVFNAVVWFAVAAYICKV